MQYRRENRNKINFGFPLVYCANLTSWIIFVKLFPVFDLDEKRHIFTKRLYAYVTAFGE